MYKELVVRSPGRARKVFLQNGFYMNTETSIRLHKHKYADLHVISGGKARFSIDGVDHEIGPDALIMIPKNSFHTCISQEKGAKHTAFQIEFETDGVRIESIDKDLVRCLFREIEECGPDGDHTRLVGYLTLITSHFEKEEALPEARDIDYGFQIYEFFNMNYDREATLGELASALCLSERQTERLVLLHMGCPFREQLAKKRIEVASRLIDNSDLSLEEISRYVGYKSYSGFYKAQKKYREEIN